MRLFMAEKPSVAKVARRWSGCSSSPVCNLARRDANGRPANGRPDDGSDKVDVNHVFFSRLVPIHQLAILNPFERHAGHDRLDPTT